MPTFYPELRLVIMTGDDDTVDLTTTALASYVNVIGNAGSDTITGNAFDNILNGEAGDDSLTGGAGNDTYVVDAAGDVVVEANNNAGSGSLDQIRTSVSYTLPNFVEILTLTNDADGLTLTGNGLDNTLTGAAGENTLTGADGNDSLFGGGDVDSLVGGAGDDTLDGGDGVDNLVGGAGNDVYFVTSQDEVITEEAGAAAGTDTVNSTVTYTVANSANIENVTLTGTAAINATGNNADNVLTGNSGVNNLTGGEGNDLLNGGAGADILNGGNGNDAYFIDNAGDAITDTAGTDTVTSSLVNYTLVTDIENATAAVGTQAFNLTGNATNNVLTGNAGANVLNGGAGVDAMTGGAGNDTYVVDNTLDTVVEVAGGGVDTVQTSVRFTLAASAEVEFLTATGRSSITLTGSSFGNTIEGNAGRNVLSGLGGNDVLNGGLGRDDLRGGVGRDTFQFDTRASAANADRVLDFNVRDDSIQLDNAVFAKLGRGTEARPGKLSAAFFKIIDDDVVQDSNDYLLYNRDTGVLSYDTNGSAAGGQVAVATLSKNLKLTAADFFVI